MPGILGLASSEDPASVGPALEQMLQPLRRRPWLREAQWRAGGAGLASVGVEDQAMLAEEGDCALAVAGEISDQEQLAQRLAAAGVDKPPIPRLGDLLLRAYRRFGAEALCGLNGLYVIAVWEASLQQLTLVNDRYGFRRLYYWQARRALLFASEYKAFLRHPEFNPRVSEAGLADFLAVGYALDDRTLFADVHQLPPASVLTYRAGTLSLRHYWDYAFGPAEAAGDPAAYLETYAQLTREAVRKRLAPGLGLQLTGGLDSRCLAGVLREVGDGLPVETVTLGHAHCHDVRFGRSIARQCGYRHTFTPVGSDFYAVYARECVWRLEGLISVFTAWIFALDDYLQARPVRHLMNGFLGGTLSGSTLKPQLSGQYGLEAAAERLYADYYNVVFTDQDLAALLRPGPYAAARGESFATIRRTFLRPGQAGLQDRVLYVDLHQRQRRFTASHIDVAADYCRTQDPFTDNALADFALQLPLEHRLGQRLYKQMLVRCWPQVAKVPHTVTGLPLDMSGLSGTAARLSRALRRRLGPRHDYRAAFHFSEWLRTGSRAFALQVLERGDYLEDLFEMKAVRRQLDDFMDGRADNYRQISALLTFALWRQAFADRQPFIGEETLAHV